MAHDDARGERVAGWYHIGFGVMYLLALLWHVRGGFEHFSRSKGE